MNDYFNNIVSTVFRECYEKNKPYISNFLTVAEQEIFILESKKYPSLNLSFDGGIKNAEYQKAIINPNNKDVDNEISIIKISFNPKYLTLTHRILLGTLIHLGVSRNRIGDMVIKDDYALVAVCSNLVTFFKENLTSIHHQEVQIKEHFEEVILEDNGVEKTIFLQSVRLDSVIAQAFNLSREESTEIIKREMVKVNQKVAVKSFQNLKACDIISVAHKGRIKIIDDSTLSRSGRVVMKIKIYR